MGIITVLWEKWVEFRRDFYKITVAAMISPLMYLIIFGMGIQTTSHGEPYLHFLIPGIVAMATMTGSFSAIAQNMSVQRLYEKALDQIMVSPTPLWQFILGQVIGGSLRGMYAALGEDASITTASQPASTIWARRRFSSMGSGVVWSAGIASPSI